MAETDVFYCEVRERTGSGGARAARAAGFVPGILYGGDKGPVAIQLRQKEVLKAHAAGRMRAHLAKIDVPGQDYLQPVIAREVQVDPVRDLPIHVDLMRVDENTRIDVAIPVRFKNEELSPGIKRGGVLNIVRHTVELYCPATAIPEFIVFDLDGLDIGAAIHISATKLPEGVTPVIADRDFTVATIAAPSALRSEENEETAATAEVPATAQKAPDAAAGAKPADKGGKK
ncbi:MAG: 50S ribosomal protein L25/general stress protein Ctc [Parvularculaceae bacterium]|nr:50S ribosomal protein L25/general stress protein Ctc [Parvularculaceae bacterium]